MSGVLLITMALASYRLFRLWSLDTWPPSEAIRDWLDARAAKSEVQGEGFWPRVHEMWICPWCSGTWAAGAVVWIVDVMHGLPLPLLQWGAVACLVGLIGKVDD